MDEKDTEISRLHLWVTGRVQGVGFRACVLQSGSRLELTGWVRNVGHDGVETVAEGQREILERFLQEVKTGPRASRVDEVRLEWGPATGEFRRFEVKYSL